MPKAKTDSKAADQTAAKTELVFSEVADISAIPETAKGSHKYDSVLEFAKKLPKGKAFSFAAPSRSSLTTIKKKVEDAGYDMTTRTQKDGTITAWVSNPA